VHAESGIPVTGVAKSRFRTATHAVSVPRGSPVRPLFVTAAGMPAADAADLIRAHGRPVPAARRAAPRRRPRASRPDRSRHHRRPARLTYAGARNAADQCVPARREVTLKMRPSPWAERAMVVNPSTTQTRLSCAAMDGRSPRTSAPMRT
jgi:hypothetical protein